MCNVKPLGIRKLCFARSFMLMTNCWIHANFGMEPNVEPVLSGIRVDSLNNYEHRVDMLNVDRICA